jgi:stage II sporulation protein D
VTRRPGIVPALVAAILGVGLLAAPSASAADDWTVPSSSVITVNGHGYGHGHGMSQYGAEGAAQQGLGYRDILGFYYPGTQQGTAGGKVKILITADTTKDVVVAARDRLQVTRISSGKHWDLARLRPGATRWRIKPATGARSEVSYKTRGWHVWKTFPGDAEFDASNQPIKLFLPKGRSVEYRGVLRSVARDTVNIVGLDRYLQGVVPLEVPATWHPEAVRTQAVAARTYAAFERANPIAAHYQICDTTACQVYGGYSAEHPDSNAAVAATRKQVLTYDGEPAFTQFSSSNGGWTAAGFVPYLVAKEDPYDGWSGNPNHTWSRSITDKTIEQAWPAIGDLKEIHFSGRDGNGEWGGRVALVKLIGTSGTKTMSGSDFRSGLGLKSEWIDLTVAEARQLD